VLVRGCAIPVAWKVLPYNQKGSWQPHWNGLLEALRGSIPADWEVLVLADRGLRHTEHVGEVARACLRFRGQPPHDAEPDRMPERPEQVSLHDQRV